MEKTRWGILSTADIGMSKVTPAIMASPDCEVVAIASRDAGAARAAADVLGIAGAHGSYEALLADPQVEIIYNPLPNHLHVDWTLRAAAAGKHVLCEKPIGLNLADARRLQALPEGIVVAEAFMVRHHPQWKRMREIARSGELGEVRLIRGQFSYYNVDPDNVRNKADIGGGGILDIGCYPVVTARYIFGAEPERVVALVDFDPEMKTDRLASVILDFGGGRQALFSVSTQLAPAQSVEVFGTRMRAEVVIPFNAPPNMPTALLVDDGTVFDGSLARREILPACDQYTEQATAFAAAVRGSASLEHGLDDSLANMAVLDAIAESARKGGWVRL